LVFEETMSDRIKARRARVLVIGAGVSGLTTALCLRWRGLGVTVVAEKFAPNVTSVVAGALWEWPPAVCGYHHDQLSLARSKDWCMASYEAFARLADDPATGVFMRPVTFYFSQPVRENLRHLAKMEEIRARVRGFVHDPGLIQMNGVNPEYGLRDAYSHVAPMIDTDAYMAWLLGEVRQAGCRVVARRIAGDLRDREVELRRRFQVDAIVNCSGLGSRELASDPMYPLRGALIRVRNDGRAMPRITQAHCVSHDESRADQDIVFIVPRGRDMAILGGLAEPDEWARDIGLHNYKPVADMYDRCMRFMPILKSAEIDGVEPVRVGLRPFRKRNVRLDREPGSSIVHNYGHGGAGVTFSWGCAGEVADMVESMFYGTPADGHDRETPLAKEAS
jgi:D-amino-acid oxidase